MVGQGQRPASSLSILTGAPHACIICCCASIDYVLCVLESACHS
jgi:hypothetical protein